MASSVTKKDEVLVVGGTGAIGSAIVRELVKNGHDVVVMTRGLRSERRKSLLGKVDLPPGVTLREVSCDVTDLSHIRHCDIRNFDPAQTFKGIVYAVGDNPPGGFDKAVDIPLVGLPSWMMTQELNRQVIGLLHVVNEFSAYIKYGGYIVAIGSAITRLTDETCPPWLHAGNYATAKAAQRELVRWLRRDPSLKEKGILVHLLSPGAVDTQFHQGCVHLPPAMLKVEDVARRVLEIMQSKTPVEEMMLAKPPV